MHVLHETEASCHRPEDVSSSLRGLPTLKELSATLHPGLRTPNTRTEGPLVRDDAASRPLAPRLSPLPSRSLSRPARGFLLLSLPSSSAAAVPVISGLARVENSSSPRAPALLL